MAVKGTGSVASKSFSHPTGSSRAVTDKLMSPNAKEDPETVSGSNPLVPWSGGSGKPKGLFGPRGKDF